MREIPCNLCKGDFKEELFFLNNFRIVKCKNCGLVFVDPQPEKEEIEQFYKTHQNFYLERYNRKKISKLKRSEKDIKRIQKFLKSKCNFSKISLLDIGCGCGFLLKSASDIGWDVCGIDISESEVKYAKTQFGVNAKVAHFPEEVNLPHYFFNVITMFDLIEHLPNPFKGLKKCFHLLYPGGFLVIGTPNIQHFKAKRLKEKWLDLKPPEHLFYFSFSTLKSLCEKAGFKYIGSFFKFPWKEGIKAVFQKP